jgi:hypothetical protein
VILFLSLLLLYDVLLSYCKIKNLFIVVLDRNFILISSQDENKNEYLYYLIYDFKFNKYVCQIDKMFEMNINRLSFFLFLLLLLLLLLSLLISDKNKKEIIIIIIMFIIKVNKSNID